MNVSEHDFDDKDISDDVDFEYLKEAFNSIDVSVDRMTKSGALIKLWHFMNDFVEFNKENRKKYHVFIKAKDDDRIVWRFTDKAVEKNDADKMVEDGEENLNHADFYIYIEEE